MIICYQPIIKMGVMIFGIVHRMKILILQKYMLKINKIKYFCSSPENFKMMSEFDVSSKYGIIEHVEDVDFS